ncbi:hypothetical protein NOF04DRAFT_1283019 [Fusarium oxysporum II5]|nr:hypothetical protein NOF04DRAFT_1283019 [Fusarium oxysporum II5]
MAKLCYTILVTLSFRLFCCKPKSPVAFYVALGAALTETWTHQGSDSGTNSTVRSVYAKRITLVIETAELRAAVPLLRPTDEMLHGWREEKETDRANIIFDEDSYATDEMDIDLKILAESSRECDRGQSAPSIVLCNAKGSSIHKQVPQRVLNF